MGRKLLKTVQTITTFQNSLADPMGTRRGPPLVRGPLFENRYHMQICTSLQTNNHASTPPLSFLQAVCPSCRPTNSVKVLKAL